MYGVDQFKWSQIASQCDMSNMQSCKQDMDDFALDINCTLAIMEIDN